MPRWRGDGKELFDDKRFLFMAPPTAGRAAPFTVVLNWAAALKK